MFLNLAQNKRLKNKIQSLYFGASGQSHQKGPLSVFGVFPLETKDERDENADFSSLSSFVFCVGVFFFFSPFHAT